ncbi:MAG: alpha/beta hydrolase, partial [Candidatus Sericytochromatia bacterium]
PALVARGEAVLTAHLPGHGRGGTDRFTVEATRRRLDALLAVAAGLGPPVVLLGQSMGGAFALDAVVRGAPVTGLATVSAPLALPAVMPVWRELGAALARENWPAARQAPPGELLPAVGPYKRDRFPIRIPAGASYIEAFRRALLALDLPRRLAAAPPAAPALLLHGSADGVIPAAHGARLARAYGDRAELVLLPGCHHLDVLIRPRVIDRLTRWFDEQKQQAGV